MTSRSHQSQWQLRKRDSSQRSSEPQSAPSGIACQQSENFQRFYRAVVSPTHVRVTAGGRIVPNTRGIAPPKYDWNPDKGLFEHRIPLTDTQLNSSTAQPLLLPNGSQPIISSPLLSGPFPSYPFLPQSASLAHATMAQNSGGLPGHVLSSSENSLPAKETTNDPLQPMNLQQPIKVSPPSQFDHSRPFMFNGQVVYPAPAGFQPPHSMPFPVTVLGDPNMPHQGQGSFLPRPYPMPFPVPFMIPPGPVGHLPMMLPNNLQHLEGGVPMAPYMPQPAPTMLSLSELTKFQIQGFRNQLKHIDDQLANNRHMVDAPFLQHQRNELMAFVEKMEAMLQTQLSQEGGRSSGAFLNDKPEKENAASNSGNGSEIFAKGQNSRGPELSKPTTSQSSATSNGELKKTGSVQLTQVTTPVAFLHVPTSEQSATQTKSENIKDIPASTDPSVDLKPLIRSEPATKSRLTVAAAKAPPFQPRAHTLAQRSGSDLVSDSATPTSNDSVTVSNKPQSTPQIQHGPLRNRLTAPSSSDWGHPIQHPEVAPIDLPRAHSLQAPHISDANLATLLQRSYTVHAPSSAYEAAYKPGGAFFDSPRDTPYLIGTLPQGIHLSQSNGSDFIYARPLTEDELRARHLYWGSAPRSVMKGSGLPKFDGKDFYPPSPVKGMATPAAAPNGYSKSATTPIPDFAKLFTEPGNPNYQTPPQVRAKRSEQDLKPTPTQDFLENDIIGFQSPSPRPSTYTFDHRHPKDWSSSHYAIDDVSTQKETVKSVAQQTRSPVPEDFSNLFMSPTAPHNNISSQSIRAGSIQPTTPENKDFTTSADDKDDGSSTLDSWGAPRNLEGCKPAVNEDATSAKTNTIDSRSNASTVEIRLTARDQENSPKRGHATTSFDRRSNTLR